MNYHFISYPKSGRSWLRFALTDLDLADKILFHHDDFEYNDSRLPQHNFDLEMRLEKYAHPNRIVYLSRNPKDVMVSHYRQVTGRFADSFNYQGDISGFLRDDYFGAYNLKRFHVVWFRLCEQGRALHVSYEQCHEDFASVLQEITIHYQFNIDGQRIRRATKNAQFDNMKEIERLGAFPQPWLRPRLVHTKVRRGKVGGYRDSLCENDIAFMDSVFD